MVLGLKPMGKPTTWMRKQSFGQNKGIAWSSDSSLWGNQLLKMLSFGQYRGIAWSSDSNPWGNQSLKENSRLLRPTGKLFTESRIKS